MARLGLGNMLAVDEERRERAWREISWVPRFSGRVVKRTVVCDGVGTCHFGLRDCWLVVGIRGGVCLFVSRSRLGM